MWYLTWVLGIGFAVLLAIMNAMWGETREGRIASARQAPGDAADRPGESADAAGPPDRPGDFGTPA